ncbi:MAG: hypothetical protein K6C36_00180 [Clostridia bacterium]|nr:hypothetical protein [Clostridia bacterium]
MLGKLIKHDFKSGASDVGIVYLIAGIVALTMVAFLVFDFGQGKIVSSVLLLIVCAVAVLVTFISVIRNFSKTMYGDRGYLTHALPVKSSSLIFSKWFVSTVWVLISYLMLYIAFFCVYNYLSDSSGSDMYDMIMMMLETMEFVPSQKILTGMIIAVGFKGLINMASLVIFIFFAITMGYVRPFHKLGGVGQVLYFFGTYYIVRIIGKGLSKLAELYFTIQDSGLGFTFSDAVAEIVKEYGGGAMRLTETYVQIIAAIVLFIITTDLVDRKVNIK